MILVVPKRWKTYSVSAKLSGDQVDENNRFTLQIQRATIGSLNRASAFRNYQKVDDLLIKCIDLRRYGPRSHQNMPSVLVNSY